MLRLLRLRPLRPLRRRRSDGEAEGTAPACGQIHLIFRARKAKRLSGLAFGEACKVSAEARVQLGFKPVAALLLHHEVDH